MSSEGGGGSSLRCVHYVSACGERRKRARETASRQKQSRSRKRRGTWHWKVWLRSPQLLKVGVAAGEHKAHRALTCVRRKKRSSSRKGKLSKKFGDTKDVSRENRKRVCGMRRKRRVGVFMHGAEQKLHLKLQSNGIIENI